MWWAGKPRRGMFGVNWFGVNWLMNRRQWKSAALAAVGTIAGIVALLLIRSIPIAAGAAATFVVALIVLKHLALAIIVGSPLAAVLPKIRSHCPFARY